MTVLISSEMLIALIVDEPETAARVAADIKDLAEPATVHVLPTEEEALRWLDAAGQSPDLFLLGSSAFDPERGALLGRITSDPGLAFVPVAVLTSPGQPLDVATAFDRGADAYISKINERHDLSATLGNAALHRRALRQQDAEREMPRRREAVTLVVGSGDRQVRDLARAMAALGIPAPETVDSGEDAVMWVASHACDVCVVDYRLPGIDGVETLISIHQRRPDLPIIMVSGAGSERAAIAAFHAGAVDYVPKEPGFVDVVARLVHQIVHAPPGTRITPGSLASPDIPPDLLLPTYQNRLRVIGRQLDLYRHGSVKIVEVPGGFLVRGTIPGSRTPETLAFHDRFFPQFVTSAIGMRRGGPRQRSPSPLLTTGYEDFCRALGFRLDEEGAQAVSITELGDRVAVRGVRRSGGAADQRAAPFRWMMGPNDIAELLDQARGRRAR